MQGIAGGGGGGIDDRLAGPGIDENRVTAAEHPGGIEGGELGGQPFETGGAGGLGASRGLFGAAAEFVDLAAGELEPQAGILGAQTGGQAIQDVAGSVAIGGDGAEESAIEFVDPLLVQPDQGGRFAEYGMAGGHFQAVAGFAETPFDGIAKAPVLHAHCFEQIGPLGRHQLGGGGRRRRPQIGDKIGDGEINFMSDRADHRDLRGGNCPRHDLLVERPEILHAAAAAGDDNDIAGMMGIEPADAGHDLGCRILPLHRGRDDAEMEAGKPAADDVEEIADGGPFRRGDDADAFRQIGDLALALRIEQPFGGELGLELLELFLEIALAAKPELGDAHLVRTARFIDGQAPMHLDLHPFTQLHLAGQRRAAEKDRRQLTLPVLEGEIDMAAAVDGQVRNLAAQPEWQHRLLQQVLDESVDLGYRPDVRFAGSVVEHRHGGPFPAGF